MHTRHLRALAHRMDRRAFLGWSATRGLGLVVASGAAPSLLAACAASDRRRAGSGPVATTEAEAAERAETLVGDVVDFSLTPDGWKGQFGYVTLRLHRGVVDGKPVHFIRTDASDRAFATAERLVFVPKLAALAAPGLSGSLYLFDGGTPGQVPVFSSEPGRDGYTPAWTVHRVRWRPDRTPRPIGSTVEIAAAERSGALTVERTGVVVNYAMVVWSTGALPVDTEKTAYLGRGQLLEPPDTTAGRVTFKLGQCYPANRYFVCDHSMEPMAAMTSTNFAPGLQDGPTRVGATGRTNVFLNGIPGPGPMGFQPSVFDFGAGDAAWSPYWDHFAYRWAPGRRPRLITSQEELFAARDAGELEEFPGTPDTGGAVFTVNCPVPVRAPNTFRPA
jgi:hypothetical protein